MVDAGLVVDVGCGATLLVAGFSDGFDGTSFFFRF